MKNCTTCKVEKPLDAFHKDKSKKDGITSQCKVCRKEYRLKNKEKASAYSKEYNLKNQEKISVYNKEYGSRPEARKKINERLRDRYNNDILYRLMQLLQKAVWNTFKGYSKPEKTMKLLYCTLEQFKSHIEKQFTKGMNWENQGEWHLDHIKPMNAFDLLDENEKRYCNHWSNFQPLWGPENMSKKDSWTKEDESNYTPPDLDKAFELWDSEEI